MIGGGGAGSWRRYERSAECICEMTSGGEALVGVFLQGSHDDGYECRCESGMWAHTVAFSIGPPVWLIFRALVCPSSPSNHSARSQGRPAAPFCMSRNSGAGAPPM